MKFRKVMIISSILVILFTLQTSLANKTLNIDQIYFFGDSLSDTGYMNHSKSYVPNGQSPVYTTPNGHPAVYYVGQYFNQPTAANNLNPPPNNPWVAGTLNGNDYAAGGAVTHGQGLGLPDFYNPPSLQQQISNFLAAHQIKQHSNNLYIVWVGANNILKALKEHQSDSTIAKVLALKNAIDKATNMIVKEVSTLHKAGAKHIIVLNLPPIGNTPFLSKTKLSRDLGNFTSDLFNAELSFKLLSSKLVLGRSVNIFNVNALFKNISIDINTSDTGSYQEPNTALVLKNDKEPACLDSRTQTGKVAINCEHWVSPAERATYVFADGMHPSDTAHRILALHLEKFIRSVLSR